MVQFGSDASAASRQRGAEIVHCGWLALRMVRNSISRIAPSFAGETGRLEWSTGVDETEMGFADGCMLSLSRVQLIIYPYPLIKISKTSNVLLLNSFIKSILK